MRKASESEGGVVGGVLVPDESKVSNTTGCLCKPGALKQQNPFK